MTLEDWVPPTPTKYDLDYADLTVIDISKFDRPNGRFELANELKEAISKDGFWVVTGHGIDPEQVNRQMTLANHFFKDYPLDDKMAKTCDFEKGDYLGYKPHEVKTIFGTDVKDNVEILNMPKFNGIYDNYYQQTFLKRYQDELARFSKLTFGVGQKLLVLFAIILEIDENYFVDRNKYEEASDDHLRYMKYHPRPLEEDQKVEQIHTRGHTDFGQLTLLFNQPVAGLQIKLSNGDWKYVKSSEDGIICNIGDTLSFWSNNYFKSTIHRVVRPPPDQDHLERIGLFYFIRPGNHEIKVIDSPLLRRLGLYTEKEPINGIDYVRKRVENYHNHKEYLKQQNAKFKVGAYEIADGYN